MEIDERIDYGEDRWIGTGFLRNGVAVVVWTERQGDVIRSQGAGYQDLIKHQILPQCPNSVP